MSQILSDENAADRLHANAPVRSGVNGEAVVRRMTWRIVPLLGVLYVVSFLDRVNIGFAALTMNSQLGISATVYGWAAGVFFFGYLLFQVPSNLLMLRFGARRWMACILVAWGLTSMSMALVYNGTSLIIVRFVLGLAEAGFFPGAILYLTTWFPVGYRGRIIAGFMFAQPISYIIGAPISGFILNTMAGWHGLTNWQWLFIVESAPALLGAVAILLLLPDRPESVVWLSNDERGWLTQQLRDMSSQNKDNGAANSFSAIRAGFNLRIFLFSLGYFGLALGNYGIGLWLPQIIAQGGRTPLFTGIVSAIPYLFGAAAMIVWGRLVDRKGAGVLYAVLPGLLAAFSLAASTLFNALPAELVFLTFTTMGIFSGLSTFWAYSTRIIPLAGTAIAVAIINSIGNLGGFIGPVLVGGIKDATHSFQLGLLALAALILFGVCVLPLTRPQNVR